MFHRQGFSLTEVLITLLLLGVIAAFAVPKMMQAVQTTQNDALFRDTLAMVQGVIYDGNINQQLEQQSSLMEYLSQTLNPIKTCKTDFQTEGCYTQVAPANPVNGGGFVFSNGVVIVDITTEPMSVCTGNPTGSLCNDGWYIDINGDALPNQEGQDILYVGVRYGGVAAVGSDGVYRKVAQFTPSANLSDVALWRHLYQ